MFIVKVFGVVLIVASSTSIGILKSTSLFKRREKLSLLLDGVNTLYNYIQQSEFELKSAIKNAFLKCDFLKFSGDVILCDSFDLKNDKAIIEEFFMCLGNSTKKVECDNINHFKLKLNASLKEAENDITQKSKIYQTLGVCIGLTIGILLI